MPLAYYVAGASAHGGLYEEGTFVAAARTLGVPHPPGAPITSLIDAFFALLPVGPLSFRVAIASAVCVACTLALFSRALFFTLLGVGLRSTRQAARLALAATWFIAQTPLFTQQATRANVFAAQFMLSLLVIDALVRFELSEPTDDRRTLYLGAFMQGLCFANHHVFALLMLSVAAPTLGRVLARRGFLGLMGHVALPILGFSAYVYVPIRGGRHPFINIGDPSSLLRSLWVLTADPWWGPSDAPTPSTLAQLSRGLSAHDGAALLLALFALYGFALSARAANQRRFAALWLIALAVPLASIAWIIEPKLTSDAWGALTPCALSLVALATCGIGLTFQQFALRFERPLSFASLGFAIVALLALVLRSDSRGLADYRAPDALDDLGRRALPPRALLLTYDAGTWFRHLGSEAEEALRADVMVVPLPFLSYPNMREQLVQVAPELRQLLGDGARDDGKLDPAALRRIAALRPTYLELDQGSDMPMRGMLTSDGLYERVGVSPDSVATGAARAAEESRFARLYARLEERASAPELNARLARVHRRKALALARADQREAALLHVRLSLAREPRDRSMLRLESALSTARPLPVRPGAAP